MPDVLAASGRTSRQQFQGGPMNGQFDGDLYPGGISALYPNHGNAVSGNLMGPNHPIFNAQINNDDDVGGFGQNDTRSIGFYGMMKPRFDPFGPPGGPTEQHSLPQNALKGGTGNPNNDLAIPPPFGYGPSADNNMFL